MSDLKFAGNCKNCGQEFALDVSEPDMVPDEHMTHTYVVICSHCCAQAGAQVVDTSPQLSDEETANVNRL